MCACLFPFASVLAICLGFSGLHLSKIDLENYFPDRKKSNLFKDYQTKGREGFIVLSK